MKNFIKHKQELDFLEKQYQKQNHHLLLFIEEELAKLHLLRSLLKTNLPFIFLAFKEMESQNIEYFKRSLSSFLKNTSRLWLK